MLSRKERFECVIAHAGGVCIRQCAHCRILYFFARNRLPLPRTALFAKNANESLRLRHEKHADRQFIACLFS